MPMIDVYVTAGTFTDKHKLAAGCCRVSRPVGRWPSGTAEWCTGPAA